MKDEIHSLIDIKCMLNYVDTISVYKTEVIFDEV